MNESELYYDFFWRFKDERVTINGEKFTIKPYCYEQKYPVVRTQYNVDFIHDDNIHYIGVEDLDRFEYSDILNQLGLRGY